MTVSFPDTTVIDVAPLYDSAADPALDRRIGDCLEDEGSFVATGFPGSEGLDARMDRLLGFFSLPLEAKMAAAVCLHRPANPNIYRGYYPLPTRPHFSHQEIFDIGPDPAMSSPDVPGAQSFRESNAWPAVEPYRGWRDDLLDLVRLERDLGVRVIAAAARGLGLDPTLVGAPGHGRNGTLRLLHYVPVPEGFELRDRHSAVPREVGNGRLLIGSEHIDTSTLSVLWQNPVGGLQMQGRDGTWREVARAPGGLSIHLGDLLSAPTGGRLAPTRHRVVGRNHHRRSVGLFVEPDFEAEVVAPAGGVPVSYARHLVNEFPDRFEAPKAA